jgi:hypothetical protein
MGIIKALGTVAENVPFIGGIVKGVTDWAPSLEDEATVEVVGQPGASKKQLYFLALSAAFALAKRFDPNIAGKYILPPPGMLMIEYDAAGNWVRATVRYKTSMLFVAALDLVGKSFTQIGIGGVIKRPPIESMPVYAGPKCDVVGESFQFTQNVPPAAGLGLLGLIGVTDPATFALNLAGAGIPSSSKDSFAPKLPFEGKTILTPCAQVIDPNPAVQGAGGATIPSPNPKPPGDNRSRGAVVTAGGSAAPSAPASANPTADTCFLSKSMALIPLVFSALSDPGSLSDQVFTPPTAGPLGA